MSDYIKLSVLKLLPEGKPASETFEEVEVSIDGEIALAVRWRFYDSKDKALREAHFDTKTGEYLGECFIKDRW